MAVRFDAQFFDEVFWFVFVDDTMGLSFACGAWSAEPAPSSSSVQAECGGISLKLNAGKCLANSAILKSIVYECEHSCGSRKIDVNTFVRI